jgi:hypothetical protein
MLHICNQATREHPSHYNYNASSILQRTHHICSQATREHPSHRQSAQHILHFDQSVWLSAVTDRKLQVKQSIVTQNASRYSDAEATKDYCLARKANASRQLKTTGIIQTAMQHVPTWTAPTAMML